MNLPVRPITSSVVTPINSTNGPLTNQVIGPVQNEMGLLGSLFSAHIKPLAKGLWETINPLQDPHRQGSKAVSHRRGPLVAGAIAVGVVTLAPVSPVLATGLGLGLTMGIGGLVFRNERIKRKETIAQLKETIIDTDLEKTTREEAFRSLMSIGTRQAVVALTEAYGELRRFNNLLYDIEIDPMIVTPLMAVLKNPTSRKSKLAAARLLHHAADKRAVPVLIECLQSPDSETRYAAVSALEWINDPRAINSLKEVATNPQEKPLTRVAAATALVGKFKDVDSIPISVQLIETETDPHRLHLVVERLGRIGKVQDVPELKPHLPLIASNLEHESPKVVGAAAHALRMMDATEYVDELIEAAKTAEGDALYSVTWALAEFKNERSIPTLIDSLGKTDRDSLFDVEELSSVEAALVGFGSQVIFPLARVLAVETPSIFDDFVLSVAEEEETVGESVAPQGNYEDRLRIDTGSKASAKKVLRAMGKTAADYLYLLFQEEDADPNDRIALVRAAGAISGIASPLPLLEASLSHANEGVRAAAADEFRGMFEEQLNVSGIESLEQVEKYLAYAFDESSMTHLRTVYGSKYFQIGPHAEKNKSSMINRRKLFEICYAVTGPGNVHLKSYFEKTIAYVAKHPKRIPVWLDLLLSFSNAPDTNPVLGDFITQEMQTYEGAQGGLVEIDCAVRNYFDPLKMRKRWSEAVVASLQSNLGLADEEGRALADHYDKYTKAWEDKDFIYYLAMLTSFCPPEIPRALVLRLISTEPSGRNFPEEFRVATALGSYPLSQQDDSWNKTRVLDVREVEENDPHEAKRIFLSGIKQQLGWHLGRWFDSELQEGLFRFYVGTVKEIIRMIDAGVDDERLTRLVDEAQIICTNLHGAERGYARESGVDLTELKLGVNAKFSPRKGKHTVLLSKRPQDILRAGLIGRKACTRPTESAPGNRNGQPATRCVEVQFGIAIYKIGNNEMGRAHMEIAVDKDGNRHIFVDCLYAQPSFYQKTAFANTIIDYARTLGINEEHVHIVFTAYNMERYPGPLESVYDAYRDNFHGEILSAEHAQQDQQDQEGHDIDLWLDLFDEEDDAGVDGADDRPIQRYGIAS